MPQRVEWNYVRMPAKIDYLECEILHVEDPISRSIAEHQLIGYEGAALEDLGVEKKSHNFETLWANDYYYNHFTFLEKFRNGSKFNTIVHPVYGTLTGKIKTVRPVHAPDEINCVRISIEFIEEGSKEIGGKNEFVDDLVSVSDIGQEVAKGIEKNAAKNIFGMARERVDNLSAALSQIEGRINLKVSQVADFVKAMTFPLSIPGKIARTAFEICVTAIDTVAGVGQNVKGEISMFQNMTFDLAKKYEQVDKVFFYAIITAGAYIAAFKAQECFEEIQERGTSQVSRRDVEEIVQMIRRQIKEITKDEQSSPLAQVALIIAEKGRETLAKMGGYKKFVVEKETNIYAVLMRGRIDRSKAWQVCLRNDIKNPNRVSGEIYLPESDYE